MKKTALARKAFFLYRENRYATLLLYMLLLFTAIGAPATLIGYLTDHVSGWFYLATPFFIYVSFPLWFAMIIAGALLADGMKSVSGSSFFGDEPKFSDVTYRLVGFRAKDE